jgi:ABC-2 type transport system permease protein
MSGMSPRVDAIVQLALLRVRTFLREPEALFWTFGFPILMAIGLGLAFGDGQEEQSYVGVVRGSTAEAHLETLELSPDLSVQLLTAEEAERSLR